MTRLREAIQIRGEKRKLDYFVALLLAMTEGKMDQVSGLRGQIDVVHE
jgi:hypothetical protein